MFFRDTDKHKLPHMRASYGEYEAVFTLDGEFPKKQRALVKAWTLLKSGLEACIKRSGNIPHRYSALKE